jgi:LPXTG-motif cell wall-anchored protein
MFQHPSHRSNPAREASGCACGCGTCGDKPTTSFAPSDASYGVFKWSSPEGGGTKWEIDSTYLETCKEYKKQYNLWLKAAKKFDDTPSFIGLRVGGRNSKSDKAYRAMKSAKRKGEAALAKCQGKEFKESMAPPSETISDAEIQQLVSGGGASQTGEDSNVLVYVIGAGILAIGGLVVYKIVKKGKKAPSLTPVNALDSSTPAAVKVSA